MTAVLIAVAILAFGVFTGAMAGILGIGGGTFMVPFMVLALGIGQHAAEATSLLVVLPTSIVATVVLARRGAVDVRQALTLGLMGAAGGVLGALIALALPADTLRRVFAVFMLVVSARMLLGLWRTRERPPAHA
jgi:uncharacterized membrane protein YfcA